MERVEADTRIISRRSTTVRTSDVDLHSRRFRQMTPAVSVFDDSGFPLLVRACAPRDVFDTWNSWSADTKAGDEYESKGFIFNLRVIGWQWRWWEGNKNGRNDVKCVTKCSVIWLFSHHAEPRSHDYPAHLDYLGLIKVGGAVTCTEETSASSDFTLGTSCNYFLFPAN